MGVYYYFHNLTRNQANEIPVPGFGQCSWVAKLNNLSESEVIKIFQSIIEINNWNDTDTIQAAPDYLEYSLIIYKDDVIKIFQSIIEINNWNDTDTIQAAPDYPEYSLIIYKDDVIEYSSPEDEDLSSEDDNNDDINYEEIGHRDGKSLEYIYIYTKDFVLIDSDPINPPQYHTILDDDDDDDDDDYYDYFEEDYDY